MVVKNTITLHITVITGHMKNMYNYTYKNYIVQYNGVTYYNKELQYPLKNVPHDVFGFNQLKFYIPVKKNYQECEPFIFTLKDKVHNITYSNIKGYIRQAPKKRRKCAICSYISTFNTIGEIKSWVAFQRIQNVSNIIFYVAEEYAEFYKAFSSLIASGYIIVIDYTWPRREQKGFIQRCNQMSQVNACANRFKYFFDAILSIDVDEYVYSKQYPYHIDDAVTYLHGKYPDPAVDVGETVFSKT
jgi:hypothetical protein